VSAHSPSRPLIGRKLADQLEAERWLAEHAEQLDESPEPDPDWEQMAGSGASATAAYDDLDGEPAQEELVPMTEAEFFSQDGYDTEDDHAPEFGIGASVEDAPVTAERPAAVLVLETQTGHLIETLRRCTRNGETTNVDKAVDAALNLALYRIRSRARRPTLSALAEALDCSRKTVSRRVGRGDRAAG
jgi:hypothetical protein